MKASNSEMFSNSDVAITWDVRVPMRDGISLNATLYRGGQPRERLPCVMSMTPYTTDAFHARALQLAKVGFFVAVLDVRGRGDSEGVFAPIIQEPADSHDAIEWLAKH